MSATVRITPRAYVDLRNIARYTLRQWGKAQRDVYIRDLDRRFSWLAEQPHAGKHRPDIQEGYFCFPQGSHLIFYLIREGGIDIIGIPHKAMDVQNHFD